MANIQPQIDQIRAARRGHDVRESIASGLEAMNVESSGAYDAAILAQDSASRSATAAAESERNAGISAESAADSEKNAKDSADNAHLSEENAQTSATNAQNSASSAQTSATAAGNSADAAVTARDQAITSATAAGNSAKDASDARTQALQYATNAQTSATTATNAQSAASISATNAAKAAADAEAYAKAAESQTGIGKAESNKLGLVMPDNITTEVDTFGRLSAKGLTEHIADKVVYSGDNSDGVHGIRIYTDPTTKKTTLQRWDTTASEWVNQLTDIKMPADGTVTMDEDGTIHAAAKPETEDAMLYASAWEGTEAPYTYDLNIDSKYDAEVILRNTATATIVEAVVAAQMSGNGNDNILRAWGDKPEVNIPVIIRKAVR